MIRAAPLLLWLLASQAGAATMYKCVDAKGVTHYTEQPVAGCKGREVDIRPVPPPSGKETRAGDMGQSETEFRRRQIERGQQEERQAAEEKQRRQACSAARSKLSAMVSSRRLYETNAKGEREYLDDATASARISGQQAEVKKHCG